MKKTYVAKKEFDLGKFFFIHFTIFVSYKAINFFLLPACFEYFFLFRGMMADLPEDEEQANLFNAESTRQTDDDDVDLSLFGQP